MFMNRRAWPTAKNTCQRLPPAGSAVAASWGESWNHVLPTPLSIAKERGDLRPDPHHPVVDVKSRGWTHYPPTFYYGTV